MALSIEQRFEKQRTQQKAAQERARNKQLAKMNDPKERAKKLAKQKQAQERAQAKQLAKLRDPKYQRKQKEKQDAKKKAKPSKPKTPKTTKPSRGLKGRTPTAFERDVMDKIGQQGCIACLLHGRENQLISLHHVFGRTIENAHAFVLPLCCYHHDTLLDADNRVKYPDMIPVHAKGKHGGKAQWKEHNGTELELLHKVYDLAELDASILPNTH